jgi:cytochrome c oxidase subunit 1
VHFALTLVGTSLTFRPQFVLGLEGMPRRIPDYSAGTGWQGLNVVSTVGSFLIALGTLFFLVAIVRSLRGPAVATADAWGRGQALEWAAASPPVRHNFDHLPPIRSYAPLYDLRHPDMEPEDEEIGSGRATTPGGS